jgi:hypothetical protein
MTIITAYIMHAVLIYLTPFLNAHVPVVLTTHGRIQNEIPRRSPKSEVIMPYT